MDVIEFPDCELKNAPDEILIELCQSGEKRARDELFRRHDDIVKAPDEILINLCILKKENAWNEFFRRHDQFIIKQIIKILRKPRFAKYGREQSRLIEEKVGQSRQEVDIEVVYQMYEKVILRLFALKKPDIISNFKGWLHTLIKNKITDMVRRLNTDYEKPNTMVGTNLISIDKPIYDGRVDSLGDIIPNPDGTDPEIKEKLEQARKDMNNLEDRALWALRLDVIFYNPLTEEDIKQLSEFLVINEDKIIDLIGIIMARLVEKAEKKLDDLDRSGRIEAIIRRLETKLYNDKQTGELSAAEKDHIEAQIIKKSKRMATLANSTKQIIAPSRKEIGNILGEKPETVGVWLHRARKKLKKYKNTRY